MGVCKVVSFTVGTPTPLWEERLGVDWDKPTPNWDRVIGWDTRRGGGEASPAHRTVISDCQIAGIAKDCKLTAAQADES